MRLPQHSVDLQQAEEHYAAHQKKRAEARAARDASVRAVIRDSLAKLHEALGNYEQHMTGGILLPGGIDIVAERLAKTYNDPTTGHITGLANAIEQLLKSPT